MWIRRRLVNLRWRLGSIWIRRRLVNLQENWSWVSRLVSGSGEGKNTCSGGCTPLVWVHWLVPHLIQNSASGTTNGAPHCELMHILVPCCGVAQCGQTLNVGKMEAAQEMHFDSAWESLFDKNSVLPPEDSAILTLWRGGTEYKANSKTNPSRHYSIYSHAYPYLLHKTESLKIPLILSYLPVIGRRDKLTGSGLPQKMLLEFPCCEHTG